MKTITFFSTLLLALFTFTIFSMEQDGDKNFFKKRSAEKTICSTTSKKQKTERPESLEDTAEEFSIYSLPNEIQNPIASLITHGNPVISSILEKIRTTPLKSKYTDSFPKFSYNPASEHIFGSFDCAKLHIWEKNKNNEYKLRCKQFGSGYRVEITKISPDNTRIAVLATHRKQPAQIRLLDQEGKKELRTINLGQTYKHQIEWNAPSKLLAICHSPNPYYLQGPDVINIWDTETGTCIKTLNPNADIAAIQFNPRNPTQLAVACKDSRIKIFDTTNNNFIQLGFIQLGFENHLFKYINFCSDGTKLIAESLNTATRHTTISIWDTKDGTQIKSFENINSDPTHQSFAVAQEKNILAVTKGRTLTLWDIEKNSSTKSIDLSDYAIPLGISPDGTHVALIANKHYQEEQSFTCWGGRYYPVVNTTTGQTLFNLEPHIKLQRFPFVILTNKLVIDIDKVYNIEGFQKLPEIKKYLTERLTLRQAALLEVIAHALENNQKPALIETEWKTLETFDPLVKEILEGYIQ